MNKFRDRECLGYRKVIKEETVQVDGKAVKKAHLANKYVWMRYGQVNDEIDTIARGLLSLGVQKGTRVPTVCKLQTTHAMV